MTAKKNLTKLLITRGRISIIDDYQLIEGSVSLKMSFDNITYRISDRKRRNLTENFFECTDSEDSNLADMSNISLSSNVNTGQNQQTPEILNQIGKLQKELNNTREQLQKLLTENQELRKRIENIEQKMPQDKITKETENRSNKSTTSNKCDTIKRRLARTQSTQTFQDFTRKKSTSIPIQAGSKRNTLMASSITTATIPQKIDIQKSKQNEHDTKNTNRVAVREEQTPSGDIKVTNKHSIFILGDQQVKGLSSILTDTRKNKWNDKYNTCALIKPNALCSEVLSYTDTLCNTLKLGDKVVLAIGSNDNNPYLLLQNLCIALHKLQKFKVYILKTISNKYLQEAKLNSTIFTLTKTFQNSEYIQINSTRRTYEYLVQVAKTLNFKIDSDDYDEQFTYKTKNKQLMLQKIKKLNITHTISQHRLPNKIKHNNYKGTIPYFFEKQLKNKYCKKNENSTSQDTLKNTEDLLKKGTIPYYFKKLPTVHTTNKHIQQLFRA